MGRFQLIEIFRIVLVILLVVAPAGYVCGDEADNMEEILDGFESESTETDTEAEEMADVLDGFGEEPPQAGDNLEDDILQGFEDETEIPSGESAASAGSSMVSLDGYTKLSSTYNFAHKAPAPGETDWRGLSKLRAELQVELEFDLAPDWELYASGRGFYDAAYILKGRDDFTREVLDENESELEIKDTYLQGRMTRNLDIKLGRQIVVWGKSDNIRVTDVLNPLDLREPGLTDIENLRLPVVMSRLDYYFGDFSLTGMGIHEVRFNKTPAYGSDFYPLPGPMPPEIEPDSTLENTQYALALNGIFSKWDMALYWADIYNQARPERVTGPSSSSIRLKHDRIRMVGGAVNIALGNWLLKTEAAYFDGLKFLATGDEEKSRIDLLAGVEYSGFDETAITVEAANRHINDFESAMESSPDNAPEDDFQWVIRINREFMNDTLALTLLANTLGIRAENGAFQRLTLEYDLTDALSVLGGVVFYQSGDKFPGVEDNDRLIFDVTYHF